MPIKTPLMMLLALALSACQTPWYQLQLENADLSKRVQDTEEENERLRLQLEGAQKDLNLTASDLEKLKAEKAARDAKLSSLRDSMKGTDIEVTERNGQMCLILPNSVFFSSGKHELTSKGKSSLSTVASVLNGQYGEFKVIVEGHTDSDPIKKSHYADNYQLSAERARSVLLNLMNDGKVKAERLSGAFYGPHRPAAPNSSESGKGKNRRVELVLCK